jgi:hypothetical protein
MVLALTTTMKCVAMVLYKINLPVRIRVVVIKKAMIQTDVCAVKDALLKKRPNMMIAVAVTKLWIVHDKFAVTVMLL